MEEIVIRDTIADIVAYALIIFLALIIEKYRG